MDEIEKTDYIWVETPNLNSSYMPIPDFIAITPTTITTGESVTFQNTTTMPAGCPQYPTYVDSYTIFFGDGTSIHGDYSDFSEIEHQYSTAGSYTVSLQVCNPCGCPYKNINNFVVVSDNQNNQVSCSSWPVSFLQQAVNEPVSVSLNAYVILEDFSVSHNYEYTFDFGDGTSETSNTTSTFVTSFPHNYSTSGDFQPSLTVTADGTFFGACQCDKITITPPDLPLNCNDFTYDQPYFSTNTLYTTFTSTVSGGTPPYQYLWKHTLPGHTDPEPIFNENLQSTINLLVSNILGTHKVELYVWDAAGQAPCHITKDVIINQPPSNPTCAVARICPEYFSDDAIEIPIGTTIIFENNDSYINWNSSDYCYLKYDPDIALDHALWYLYKNNEIIDNGTNFNSFSHTFNSVGIYQVTLQVWFGSETVPGIGSSNFWTSNNKNSPKYKVVDCGTFNYDFYQPYSILNIPAWNFTSGNHPDQIAHNMKLHDININTGANIKFKASNNIEVENIVIDAGSNVELEIFPCAETYTYSCSTAKLSNKDTTEITQEESKEITLILAGTETQQQPDIKNPEEFFTINTQGSDAIQKNEKSENLTVKNAVQSVTVFPNPNTGKFLIEINGTVSANTTVELRDLLGKTIYSSNILQNSSSIDLTASPAGIYFITVCAGKDCWLGKVVKE